MITREIKSSLGRSVNQLPHASLNAILSAPAIKMCRLDSITLPAEKPVKRSFADSLSSLFAKLSMRRLVIATACCAAMLVLCTGWYWQNLAVESFITIDVNPSFEITANRNSRVLDVKALNEDAKQFTNGKSFRGQNIDDAVEALFTELGHSKYLNAEKNTVLLSVRGKSNTRSLEIEHELVQHIEKSLVSANITPQVVCQSIEQNANAQKEAQEYHTSVAKLQMAKKVNEHMPDMSLEKLLSLPMEELFDLYEDEDDDDGDSKDDDTDDDDNKKPKPIPALATEDTDSDDSDDSDDDTDSDDSLDDKKANSHSVTHNIESDAEDDENEEEDKTHSSSDSSHSQSGSEATDSLEDDSSDSMDDSDDADSSSSSAAGKPSPAPENEPSTEPNSDSEDDDIEDLPDSQEPSKPEYAEDDSDNSDNSGGGSITSGALLDISKPNDTSSEGENEEPDKTD